MVASSKNKQMSFSNLSGLLVERIGKAILEGDRWFIEKTFKYMWEITFTRST